MSGLLSSELDQRAESALISEYQANYVGYRAQRCG